ncbi:transporter [Cupriavidus numazuensis]|uniref:Transporter n=1 Tax=Cupriavidus numazuensis TaxID=221992 RepID=A0ABM8TLR2_9BURK|nr:transporter [Cupriavidus numazuensis]CAG2153881.1 hypothetical protein LMG26411_04493 [Cupriavidus numazuensis]
MNKSIHIFNKTLATSTLAAASLAAHGVPIEPGDYIPLPGGSFIGVGYYNYAHSEKLNVDGVGDIKNDTSLNLNSGLLRAVWYPKTSSLSYNLQMLMPFASVNSEVAGASASTNGVRAGDPMFGAVVWPLNDPQNGRYLGLASITSFPLGSYDRFRPVSVGRNTWTENLQAVFVQQFKSGWQLDVAGDVIFYGDNNDYGAAATGKTFSQKNTYQLQLWLSKQLTPATGAGIGYTIVKGGQQKVDGQPNGLRTDYQQVRLYASHFLNKTWQVLGEVNHAFATTGGFNQDFGLTLRVVKLFQ